jgi:hypothetical protein
LAKVEGMITRASLEFYDEMGGKVQGWNDVNRWRSSVEGQQQVSPQCDTKNEAMNWTDGRCVGKSTMPQVVICFAAKIQ